MNTNFILTQIFGGIALILVCISYFVKNKIRFLAVQIFANVFYASAFLFQHLFVAGFNTLISIIRTAVFYCYFVKKPDKEIPMFIPLIFVGFYSVNFIIFNVAWYEIFVLFTSIIFTFAFYIKNMQTTRYVMLIPNIILCVYNALNMCYTSSVLDGIEFCVNLISIIYFSVIAKKYGKTEKENKTKNNKIIENKIENKKIIK